MNEKELAELLKYSSPKELYVISYNNQLKILICPFKVSVIRNIGVLRKGQKVNVDSVKITLQLQTVFIIADIGYYYYHFEILID